MYYHGLRGRKIVLSPSEHGLRASKHCILKAHISVTVLIARYRKLNPKWSKQKRAFFFFFWLMKRYSPVEYEPQAQLDPGIQEYFQLFALISLILVPFLGRLFPCGSEVAASSSGLLLTTTHLVEEGGLLFPPSLNGSPDLIPFGSGHYAIPISYP